MTALFPVALLAGGFAKRLLPLTKDLPKSMVMINDEPFIAHQLRLLKKQGVTTVVICTGFLSALIKTYIGDGQQFGLQITYSEDGDKPLGTAGAIKKALPNLGENFFVMYGDSYLLCDFAALQKEFLQQKYLAMMTVFQNENAFDQSNVVFQDGKIKMYDKKIRNTDMHYIDYGLGIFNSSVFTHLQSNENYDLEMIYQQLLRDDFLGAALIKDRFYEIGSHQGITDFKTFIANHTVI